MSRYPRRTPQRVMRALTAAALAGTFALGLGGVATVGAQEASPEASPAAVACLAPELPPGTPTPMEEGAPAAMASPMAEEAQAEEATPEPGTPADDATAAEIEAAVMNYAACFNTGDPAKYVALETERYWLDTYGTTNPYDVIASEVGVPFTADVLSVENEMTYPDGRVSADVEVILGNHWFQHLRMFFVQDGGYWKLDQEVLLRPEPEGDTVVVGVALGDPSNEYSITPNVSSTVAMPVLIFQATNGGQEVHELVVLQLPEGADPMGLIDGSISFDQVTFIGAVDDIAPGETKSLALVNLPAGVYTLACFLTAPDGKSHFEHGMYTQFEVTAPAA